MWADQHRRQSRPSLGQRAHSGVFCPLKLSSLDSPNWSPLLDDAWKPVLDLDTTSAAQRTWKSSVLPSSDFERLHPTSARGFPDIEPATLAMVYIPSPKLLGGYPSTPRPVLRHLRCSYELGNAE